MITSLTSPWIATLLTSWILVTSWNSFLARSFESSCHSQSTKYLPKARRQILLDLTLPTEWQTSRPYTVQKHHPHLKGNTYDQPRLGVSPLRPAMKKPWCFFFEGGGVGWRLTCHQLWKYDLKILQGVGLRERNPWGIYQRSSTITFKTRTFWTTPKYMFIYKIFVVYSQFLFPNEV